MKMHKKYGLFAGAMALSLTLTACGGGASTQTTEVNDGETPVAASAGEADDKAAEGGYRVATVRWADWGEDYHTGFPDEAAKEAGISLSWDTILNSDWADKKAVLLAGGDLPDAFLGSICFSESDILTNTGSFIALDDYIDEYMPNFKAVMESDPTMKALATSADGHIYGLPSKKPCRPTVSNQMFINKTWLDNLGLEVPTTYKEFEDCLAAFRDNDANGNGDPSDEIPFGQGYADSVMFFCLPFGTTLGADGTYMMTVKDGSPVYIPTSEEYKAGIEWMHDCYVNGLIDPELFTEDSSMRDAKLMNETPIVGAAPGWTADSTFGANAGEYVALPALAGPDGNQYVSSDPEHMNYSRYEFVVTSKCENPGPLLAWIDKFYTEDASIQNFYGSFGIGVEKEEDGTYTVLEPQDGNSADTFAWIQSVRDFGPKYVAEGFNDKVSYAAENGDASKLALDKELGKYAKEAYPNVSYTTDQLNTLATLFTDIDAYVTATQATWVTEGGVDEQWNDYIGTLEAMGYNDFIQIQQDAYSTYQANK
jgi:putative aldouronate transport system substrate-binding protein